MDRVFDILYNKKARVGKLYIKDGKYTAIRTSNKTYPMKLFGLEAPKTEVGHLEVKRFIEDRVTPKSREGIEDILKGLGMQSYNADEIFFRTNGREAGDRFQFVEREKE